MEKAGPYQNIRKDFVDRVDKNIEELLRIAGVDTTQDAMGIERQLDEKNLKLELIEVGDFRSIYKIVDKAKGPIAYFTSEFDISFNSGSFTHRISEVKKEG